MKRIFKGLGQALLSFLVVCILSLGIYCLATESYKAGVKVESQKTRVQTIAILNLSAENEELQSTIITLDGNNATLRILVQTKQEEIDNLKSTVTSLNSSLTSLKNDKEATDKVVEQLENDVDYLNNYVSQLESELNEFKQSVIVIYLPKDFGVVNSIYHIVLDDDTLLVSSDVYNVGVYTYTLSSQTWEKVSEYGCQCLDLIELNSEDYLIRSTSLTGVLMKYNKSTKTFSVILLDNYAGSNSYTYVLYIDTDKGLVLISNSTKLYWYDVEINLLTQFDTTGLSLVYYSYLSSFEDYVYFSTTSYGIYKVNISDKTVEFMDCGYFSYNYQANDTLFFAKGNTSANSTYAGLWLLDISQGTVTKLIEEIKVFSDFYKKDNTVYFTSTGYLYSIDLDSLNINSIELSNIYASSPYYEYTIYTELTNGFIISSSYSSTYSGLYYVSYDLSSATALFTTGWKFVTIPFHNGFLVSSGYDSLKGLYYIDKDSLEITTLYTAGCAYSTIYDLDEERSLVDGPNVFVINKDLSSWAYISGPIRSFKIIEEDYVLITTRYYVYSLQGLSFTKLYEIGDLIITETLDNGNLLLEKMNGSSVKYIFDISDYTLRTYSYEIEE